MLLKPNQINPNRRFSSDFDKRIFRNKHHFLKSDLDENKSLKNSKKDLDYGSVRCNCVICID